MGKTETFNMFDLLINIMPFVGHVIMTAIQMFLLFVSGLVLVMFLFNR